MASAHLPEPAKKSCAKCDESKSMGNLFTCTGCQRMFCSRHVHEHQQDLALEFDQLVQEHDLIQDESNRITDVESIVKKIDEWEQKSIQIIQSTAEKIRTDAIHFQQRKTGSIRQECTVLAKDLSTSKENESYTEMKLKEWQEKLENIRKSLDSLKNIIIIEKKNAPLEWIRIAETVDVSDKSHDESTTHQTNRFRNFKDRSVSAKPTNPNIRSRIHGNRPQNPRNAECKQQ